MGGNRRHSGLWNRLPEEKSKTSEQLPFLNIKSILIDYTLNLGKPRATFGRCPPKSDFSESKRAPRTTRTLLKPISSLGADLLIASSRPGSLPANLQGIWNHEQNPPWSSDFHLNINVQMNYWLAETANLGELHQPLFDLTRSYQPSGREMARRLGMKGWCNGALV